VIEFLQFELELINDVFTMDATVLKLYDLLFIGLYFCAFALFLYGFFKLFDSSKGVFHFVDAIALLFFIFPEFVFDLFNIVLVVVLLSHVLDHCDALVIEKQVYFLHCIFYRHLIRLYLTDILLFQSYQSFDIL
jgi:hypothetical protein